MKAFFILVFVTVSVSVAADEYRISGNETYAIIAPIADESKTLTIAEQHCGRYGRIPHFQRMEGFRAVFDCVPKSESK